MALKLIKNFILLVFLMGFISACTTTENLSNRRLQANARHVNPEMAQACINAAANKYYLPTSVIHAVDAKTNADGITQLVLQVDLRDALCTISAKGRVQSVVDTSPKSADQKAADERAAAKKTMM